VYILIYFLCGSLPWQSLQFQHHDLVAENKQWISTHNLCHELPLELHTLLEYSWPLAFGNKPDYNYLCSLFKNLLLQEGFENDIVFVWNDSDGGVNGQLSGRQEKHFNRQKCNKSPK
jgi:hypothetical protein